jgi:hypothetical protein
MQDCDLHRSRFSKPPLGLSVFPKSLPMRSLGGQEYHWSSQPELSVGDGGDEELKVDLSNSRGSSARHDAFSFI